MNKKKVLESVKALMTSSTQEEAYQKVSGHKCSKYSARTNATRFFSNPAILAELEKCLNSLDEMNVNKANLVKLLGVVVKGKLEGKERTSDFLKAIELLSKLVPDFVDRKAISDYEKMNEDDLDRTIKEKLRFFGDKDGTPSSPN